jgi:zinc/manganese transport system permease protein
MSDLLAWPASVVVAPFVEFGFMRRALVGCLALALGGGPVGVFLLLRRMSLIGDALSHAVLPGAAVGFLIAGLSLPAMGAGGLVAGLLTAALAGLVTRHSVLREDASFAAFYLISLALGVLLVSTRGSNVDLMHVLFGNVLAVDDVALLLGATIASVTLVAIAVLYRPLVVESFDPDFLAAMGERGALYHLALVALVVLNLVAGFLALGTLMAVGLMMLPAAAARLWGRQVWSMAAIATAIGCVSGIVGLLISFHADLPSGPSIILTAGAVYVASLVLGPRGGLLSRRPAHRHRVA